MKVMFAIMEVGRRGNDEEVGREEIQAKALSVIEEKLAKVPADLLGPSPVYYIREIYVKS